MKNLVSHQNLELSRTRFGWASGSECIRSVRGVHQCEECRQLQVDGHSELELSGSPRPRFDHGIPEYLQRSRPLLRVSLRSRGETAVSSMLSDVNWSPSRCLEAYRNAAAVPPDEQLAGMQTSTETKRQFQSPQPLHPRSRTC